MDWFRLIELSITSLTSIVIALIGAGFFRRMSERKLKAKSKENLLEQIKKDEIVHLAIRDLRRKYNADRVYVWQFHNGGTFYTNAPMQKMSITYERNSDGLERKAQKNQNLLVSNFTSYIKDVMDLNMFFSDINDVEDIGLRAIMQSNGTKSHVAVPIFDRDQHLVGIFSMDWVFSTIPEMSLKKDGSFTQDFKDAINRETDTLEKYLQ
jgi:hypothetical protein